MPQYGKSAVKARAISPEIRAADCEYNAQNIMECVAAADCDGVELLLLPELSITGCTLGDLFSQKPLLDGAAGALNKIAEFTAGLNVIAVVGLPYAIEGKIFDAAAVIFRGEILGLVPKIGAEGVFASGGKEINGKNSFPVIPDGNFSVNGIKFCVRFYDDLDNAPEFSGITAVLAGRACVIGENRKMTARIRACAEKAGVPFIMANAGRGESTTDAVFAGDCVIAAEETVSCAPFSYECVTAEVKTRFSPKTINAAQTDRGSVRLPFVPDNPATISAAAREALDIQAWGLARRIGHVRAEKLIVGVSGGLDSTLALICARNALKILNRPPSDIFAVTMPGLGTTSHTKNNAVGLAEIIGAELMEIDIKESVLRHFRDIGQDENNRNVVFENAQARERTQILMDLANMKNGLVVGTGNLSELALGFATYNGDHMSMYCVNAGIPKTLLREIVRYSAQSEPELCDVLTSILNTPISPELLPHENGTIQQQTEKIVGPYELHDFFLYHLIQKGASPKTVEQLAEKAFSGAYDRQTIRKWLALFIKRFFAQQYKRSCMPDGPQVVGMSLSPRRGFKMPSDASAALWLKDIGE